MMEKKYILDETGVAMKIRRMAYEILENNPAEQHLVIIGILHHGIVIARQLASVLHEIAPEVQFELLTLGMNKDRPSDIEINQEIDFNNRVIILVDDVTNSGKTLLYALKPLLDFYPKKIQTLVLVERSHKIYPIHPDYVGISLATTLQEHIVVETEGSTVKGAYLN
jgi:pyrimidine operon attenuation protein / uracil phosphoribosyltransferase